MIKKTLVRLCRFTGHSWQYKDYSNWMKENGDRYDFKASRKCSRCKQLEYLFENWKIAKQKSPYDIEFDSQSTNRLPVLEIL